MMASDEDTVTKFDSLTSLQDWTTDDFINVTTSEVVDFNYTTTISSLNVTGGATKSGSPLRKYDFYSYSLHIGGILRSPQKTRTSPAFSHPLVLQASLQ